MRFKSGHYYEDKHYVIKVLETYTRKQDPRHSCRVRFVELKQSEPIYGIKRRSPLVIDLSRVANTDKRWKEIPILKVLLHYPELDSEIIHRAEEAQE